MREVARQAIHDIDEDDSGLRALEVKVLRTRVDDSLLMTHHPSYIDPLRWHPLMSILAGQRLGHAAT